MTYRDDLRNGIALREGDDVQASIYFFQSMLQKDLAAEYEAEVRNHLGLSYQLKKRLFDAEVQHKKALELDPDGEGVASGRHLAAIYWQQRRYEDAYQMAVLAYNKAEYGQRSDLFWFASLLTKIIAFYGSRDKHRAAFEFETQLLQKATKNPKIDSHALAAWKRTHLANKAGYLVNCTKLRGFVVRLVLQYLPKSYLKTLPTVHSEYLNRIAFEL